MQRKRGELTPISDAVSDLDVPVPAIAADSPQAQRPGLSDVSAFQAGAVSTETFSVSGAGREKLSFSNPITCPSTSFIRTTSSPVSSQMSSLRDSENQTVNVLPSLS